MSHQRPYYDVDGYNPYNQDPYNQDPYNYPPKPTAPVQRGLEQEFPVAVVPLGPK